MSKKLLIGAGIFGVLAGVGYIAADRSADARAQAFLEKRAAGLGPGEELSWGAVDAEPLSRTAVVDGLHYSHPDGREITVRSVTLRRIGDAGPAGFELAGISFTSPMDGEVTVQAITAEDLKPLPVIPAELSGDAKAARLLTTLTAGRIAIRDIAVITPDQSGMAAVAEIVAEDVQAGRYGTIDLTDIAVSAPTGETASIASFALSGLDVSVFASGDEDAQQRAASNMFGLTELSAKDIKATGGGAASFAVGSVTLDGLERVEETLVSSRFKVDHLTVPTAFLMAKNPILGRALTTLGQDQLDASLEASQTYADTNGAFTFGPLKIRGEGLGEAILEAQFHDVPLVELARAMDAEDFAAAQTIAARVSFVKASLAYTDDRLADVLIDDVSDGNREAFAEMIATLVLANSGPRVPQEDAAVVADAVRAFLTGANGFSVTLAPEQPVLLPVALAALQVGQARQALALSVEGR